jgi:hypothetical protein
LDGVGAAGMWQGVEVAVDVRLSMGCVMGFDCRLRDLQRAEATDRLPRPNTFVRTEHTI